MWIARPDGSEATLVVGGHDFVSGYVDGAWSPDGERLAVLTFQRLTYPPVWELWLGDADGGRQQRLTTFVEQQEPTIIGWSPDGRKIYLRYGSVASWAGIAVVDTADARFEVLLRRGPRTLGQVELSPDGTMLGFADGNTIKLMSIKGGRTRVLTRGVSSQVRPGLTTFSWSPYSESLVFVADGECPTLLGLHTIGKDGKGKRRLTQFCGIGGSARADVIDGTAGTNAFYGLGGDDRIHGQGAADNIRGGQGNDTLDGGDGDDRINGGPGLDTIGGGTGWDAIISRDRQVDRIRCGPGRDIVWADDRDIVARDCEDIVWRS